MKISKVWFQRTAVFAEVLCMSILSAASQNQMTDSGFGFGKWIYDNTVFPYRKTIITVVDTQQKPALVVYLHGGPKRGSDNVSQMTEEAIYIIADYLRRNRIHSVMIVPQCPDSLTWGARTNEAIKALIDKYVEEDKVDVNRIYLLGGSMGGTGTWLMTAAYPHLFAAVMPVAGNPETADAGLVAYTPVCTVMGSDDNLMTIPRVSTFVKQLQERGGEVLFDIEQGWSHVKICTGSYTDTRLDWIFGHKRLKHGEYY